MGQSSMPAAFVLVLGLCLGSVFVDGAPRLLMQQQQQRQAAAPAAPAGSASTPASLAATPSPQSPTYPGNCAPPRTFEDTKKPFCFVPQTASPQAQQFLEQASSGAFGLQGDLNNNRTALQQARKFYQAVSINGSDAAVAALLQGTRNDTIAGVPVVFGTPKGVSSSSNTDTRLLIYLHGGGYIIGSCHYQWSTVAPTAAAAHLTVLCVEYRLAPEHPFPAGLNDALAVYKKLLQQGYQAKNIVLLGDSAGGGLVAAVAIQLQREGLPLPAALGMFSPFAELGQVLDTQATMIGVDPILPASGESMSLAYVGGNRTLLTDPLVSPLRADYATLFAGGKLPPTLIQVGLRELLLSNAVLLYHKMKQAAPAPGRVLISPYDAVWHVFQSFFTMPEAAAAHQEMGAFFARSLNGTLCSA